MTAPVINQLVDAATADDPSGGPNPEAAAESVSVARDSEAVASPPPAEVPPEARPVRVVEPSRKAKGSPTKADLQAMLDNAEARASALQGQLVGLQRTVNDSAVTELSGHLAAAITLAGEVMGVWRGPHWRFTDLEAQPVGDAWAPILAPYASKFNVALPWGVALMVTWRVLRPRLQKDAELRERKDEQG